MLEMVYKWSDGWVVAWMEGVGMNKDESFTWTVFLPPLVTMLSELVGYWNAWKEIAFQISGIFWMIRSSGGQLILDWYQFQTSTLLPARSTTCAAGSDSAIPSSPKGFTCKSFSLSKVGECVYSILWRRMKKSLKIKVKNIVCQLITWNRFGTLNIWLGFDHFTSRSC